jgi:hypothetical protein
VFQLLEGDIYEFKKLVEWHDDIVAHRVLNAGTPVDLFSDDIKRVQVHLVATLLHDLKAMLSEHKREHDIRDTADRSGGEASSLRVKL